MAYFSGENGDSENVALDFKATYFSDLFLSLLEKYILLSMTQNHLGAQNMIITESSFGFRINKNKKSNEGRESQ